VKFGWLRRVGGCSLDLPVKLQLDSPGRIAEKLIGPIGREVQRWMKLTKGHLLLVISKKLASPNYRGCLVHSISLFIQTSSHNHLYKYIEIKEIIKFSIRQEQGWGQRTLLNMSHLFKILFIAMVLKLSA
jgi:hypothetical protein